MNNKLDIIVRSFLDEEKPREKAYKVTAQEVSEWLDKNFSRFETEIKEYVSKYVKDIIDDFRNELEEANRIRRY